MGWLAASDNGKSPFEAALGLCPDLLEGYRTFYGAIWDHKVLPARLLELCRLRVAGLHRCKAEISIEHRAADVTDTEREVLALGELPDSLSDAERLALELADPVSFDVHCLRDAQVEAVRDVLGETETVGLILALSLFDLNCRLRTTLEITPQPARVEQPASTRGTLY